MILGPCLGGSYLAAYYAVGTVVAPTPTPTTPTSQPGGAYRRRGTAGSRTASSPRYPGARQIFEDGVWRNADPTIEEVGAPKPRELPFEPPTPWTPPAPTLEPVPTGHAGLGLVQPTPLRQPPLPTARPLRVTTRQRTTDEDAIIALLAAIRGTWT
jgi:hypothetical protein